MLNIDTTADELATRDSVAGNVQHNNVLDEVKKVSNVKDDFLLKDNFPSTFCYTFVFVRRAIDST
jgi:hypothetical protein